MASASNIHIKATLACAQQLKKNVCRTAEEFKQLRMRLLQSLQPINSTNVRALSIHIEYWVNGELISHSV
jgi:hypothetical protein